MVDKEKRFRKVVKFYQSLPKDLIDEILGNLSGNRDLRRRLSKIKSTNEKIEMLFSNNLRKMFADTAYNVVKKYVPLELEKAEYDEIIASITDDNKLFVTIFFFRWCYENGSDGTSNDDKYFDVFVDSEEFNRILNGETIKEDSVVNIEIDSENDTPEETVDESSLQFTETLNGEIYEEENTMKLLGRIEKRNTYYNFFPQFQLLDDKFVEIPADKLRTDYPSIGGINLPYSLYSGDDVSTFLNEIPIDFNEDQYVYNAYVVELDEFYLDDNSNEDYRLKLDLQRLIKDGKKLHSIIQYADDNGVYKIVTSEEYNISDQKFISGNIDISETNITKNEMVVLNFNDKYYGPFHAEQKPMNGGFFIKTRADESNYRVPFFDKEDVEIIELYKQAYNKNPTYTQFIHVTNTSNSFEDVITDKILLEKVADDVSIELAKTNPEAFSHLCSNSPFLAKLPQEVIEQRTNRLLEIINNVEKFKETKHTVFESLLKLYRDVPSEASDKMITESEPYKDLQTKYNEERRKNEDAEKQIQELKKIQDELNTHLVEMRKNSSGTISSEEKAQMQATIIQLQDELAKEKSVSIIAANIEALKEEQEKLKHNNEFLNDQAKEYEERIKTARTEVSNAIEASASNMASLAFDPFISSEMMKKAASWDSEEEDKEYQGLHNELSNITPSSLSDKNLVDYIVNYVKARREYSRNDIINIYISIAQNFITIFSGEPGTGKTSMCNIVAETLGLLKFGERINRFVSVSVERGWSSKRDLIGYFNPLTRRYDKSNSKIYDALRILDVERNDSKFPFVIMLDEANLSPIEYYWADFMRLTDRTSQNDMYINIGSERELFVPKTLKFVATINTDQTTETLSPRLIDRACIIKLPKVEPKQLVSENISASEIITWDNFFNAFSKTTELNPITQKAIKEVYKLFNDYGMSVSPRIQIGIKNYVMAAQDIMEDEADALAREKALDFAIVQKLLPKINGYYTIYERFFDSLKQLCKEYNLNMTEEAITRIIDAQERNMGYCQYLI